MKIKNIIGLIICIALLVLFFMPESTKKQKVGLYGFLVDDYTGNSIECIAYADEEEKWINEILTKYGTLDVEIYYDYESNVYEEFSIDNDFHSLGYTLNANFTFNVSRDAYKSDEQRLKDYEDLQEPYFLSSNSYEYTLHLSDRNCNNYGDKCFYVPNYDVAVLFEAGMCDKCFPEMYQ